MKRRRQANSGRKSRIIEYIKRPGNGKRHGFKRTALPDIRGISVIGVLKSQSQGGFVTADKRAMKDLAFPIKEVDIPLKSMKGADYGDRVVAEITGYSKHHGAPEGKVTEIIARRGEAGGDILMIIRKFGLDKDFPKKVEIEAQRISQELKPEDILDRVDLRAERIFTIDGPNAKDFDDAVSIKKQEDGTFKLGVHIADVSHYVGEDSRIDKEALHRGTSVYPIDQVVPMIPLALSNGICSLNEGEDRLTLTVDMLVDADGRVLRFNIYESVICSKARLVYGDVSDLLENAEAGKRFENNNELVGDLKIMAELADILRVKRERRGSIDFDLDETEIELDESGVAANVSVAERRTANRMIEEFMLLANETVAEEFHKRGLPFVYRVHEKPGLEKLMEFKQFAADLGIGFPSIKGEILPSAFGGIIEEVKGKPYEKVVNTIMLRTMQKAFYGTDCLGHFGLAVKYYCHFTSPIRRYPDLMIHRIIKESLRGKIQGERRSELLLKTVYAAEVSSDTERRALELEREAEKIKKAEYMSFHLGELYDGVICGVVSFGLFVELPNTVEGLVRVDYLYDDYYYFEPEHYRLVGETSGRKYTLGDGLRVKVDSVNPERGEINFILVKKLKN